MVNVLTITQVLLAISLILLILLKRANTDNGGGLSLDGSTGVPLQKRGAELLLHKATIIIAVLFVISVSYDIIHSVIK